MKFYEIDIMANAPYGDWIFSQIGVEANRLSSAIKRAERELPNKTIRLRLITKKRSHYDRIITS